HSAAEAMTDGDEGVRQGPKLIGGRTMQDGDLVIRVDDPCAVPSINLADPLHAEAIQLSGSERANARRAKDAHTPLEREQDLAMQDGAVIKKMAVHHSHTPTHNT